MSSSRQHKFIDMYPIFPTVDLIDEHVYDLNENSIGWKETAMAKFSNIHTFFHANDDQLGDEANVARLVMFAFGYAHATSQFLLKTKVRDTYKFFNLKILNRYKFLCRNLNSLRI